MMSTTSRSLSFHSRLVRLKVADKIDAIDLAYARFHSRLVRLKVSV